MEDKQIETEKPKVISRRRFFSWMGWGSSTAFLVSSAAAMVKFFYPKVTYEPDQQFRAGFPEDFPQGKMVFLPDWKVFVVREPEGFHAISAVCTHLGCTVIWEEKLGIFYCRCHGGRFHRDGHNFASFTLSLDDNGQLVVDKSEILARSNGGMGEFRDYFRLEG
jgi:cytochrome b6-f complex iron-sulfur subunit